MIDTLAFLVSIFLFHNFEFQQPKKSLLSFGIPKYQPP